MNTAGPNGRAAPQCFARLSPSPGLPGEGRGEGDSDFSAVGARNHPQGKLGWIEKRVVIHAGFFQFVKLLQVVQEIQFQLVKLVIVVVWNAG
jgi:hypothetical protein